MIQFKYFGRILSNQNGWKKNLKQQITFLNALSESSLLSNAPQYPKGHSFLDGYWILPFILLVWATCRLSKVWHTGGTIWTGKNQSTWKKTCPSATFVHHKSYRDWPGIEPVPMGSEAQNKPPESWHSLLITYSFKMFIKTQVLPCIKHCLHW